MDTEVQDWRDHLVNIAPSTVQRASIFAIAQCIVECISQGSSHSQEEEIQKDKELQIIPGVLQNTLKSLQSAYRLKMPSMPEMLRSCHNLFPL